MIENVDARIIRSPQGHSYRRRVFNILEAARGGDRISRAIDVFLISIISLSIIAVVLESIPSVELHYADALYHLEIITVSIFTLEYVLRVWSCVESDEYSVKSGSGIRARLRFLISPYALVDFVAILPFYLLFFGTFANIDMRFLRAIRLLRILKLTRYSAGFDMLVTTCTENIRPLAAAFFILLTVMMLAASGMYFFERHSQPADFGSIPASMWWAFSTLTTVGYGDVTPVTNGGKMFGSLITVIGMGMVALPTGIIASGYAHQMRVQSEKDQILDKAVVKMALKGEATGGFCSHCGAALGKDQT